MTMTIVGRADGELADIIDPDQGTEAAILLTLRDTG